MDIAANTTAAPPAPAKPPLMLREDYTPYPWLVPETHLDFDLAISVWIGDYADPNTFLDMFETDNGNNRTGWSNRDYDRMLRESARTRDPEERFAIFQKMEALLLEEGPMLPVYFYTNAYLLDPSVKGWNPTILDNHPYKYVYLDAE